MKPILYLIIGKSGSGKNTLKDELVKLGVIPLHECTGEIDGKDYYFMSEKKFHEGPYIGKLYIETAYGNWYFGIMKEKVEDDKTYCLIVCPKQYDEVITYYKDKAAIIPVWIDTDDEQRILNIILREEHKERPDYAEVCRRIKSDATDFSEKDELILRIKEDSILIYNQYDESLSNTAVELFYDRNYMAKYKSVKREEESEDLK